jgi:predicted phosphoribosyltransferase
MSAADAGHDRQEGQLRSFAEGRCAPLDLFLVRKLGVPGQEELAMGAIASGGVRVLNEGMVRMLRIPDDVIDAVAAQERRELKRREPRNGSAADLAGGPPGPKARGRGAPGQ